MQNDTSKRCQVFELTPIPGTKVLNLGKIEGLFWKEQPFFFDNVIVMDQGRVEFGVRSIHSSL
jgi:hypothetical protein